MTNNLTARTRRVLVTGSRTWTDTTTTTIRAALTTVWDPDTVLVARLITGYDQPHEVPA